MTDSGRADGNVRYSALPQAHGQADRIFRVPTAADAQNVAALIAACPPLDRNSLYCNLLQCTHFAGTCIIAESGGTIDGWISGYRPPDRPGAVFIWQVAVSETARGCGLGVAMLDTLLARENLADVRWLKTSVTPSNGASRRMFAKFADRRGAKMQIAPWFDRTEHFGGLHESEELLSIGPL